MRYSPVVLALSAVVALSASSGPSVGAQPMDPRAASLEAIGRGALAAGDTDQATDAFEAALAVDPGAARLVLDLAETFYFKPESGRLWLSPHDETPSPPCDAAPEEIDVALAISRLEQVVDWRIERVEHRWAGLRSFAPDRLPVYGFDTRVEGLFWCAGQGGFGIQTAPAGAALAAALLLGEPGRFAG